MVTKIIELLVFHRAHRVLVSQPGSADARREAAAEQVAREDAVVDDYRLHHPGTHTPWN